MAPSIGPLTTRGFTLVTLAEPTPVRLVGAIARPVRRLGLHVDDPDGFIAAIDDARAAAAVHAV